MSFSEFPEIGLLILKGLNGENWAKHPKFFILINFCVAGSKGARSAREQGNGCGRRVDYETSMRRKEEMIGKLGEVYLWCVFRGLSLDAAGTALDKRSGYRWVKGSVVPLMAQKQRRAMDG